MIKGTWTFISFVCDLISIAFVVTLITGVLQVVKGPYWGNFMNLIGY